MQSQPDKERTEKRTYMAGAERRSEILRHALAAFAERGYHATTIADICARAGIGRATLYQYFTDKRDLLVALADGVCSRVLAEVESREPLRPVPGVAVTEAAILELVQRRFQRVLGVLFEDADTARLVLRTGRGAVGVVDELLARIDGVMLARIEGEVAAAKAAGLLRDVEPAVVARYFLGGIEKLVMSYLEEGKSLDLPAITREATLLQLYGVLRRPEPPPTAP